MTMEQSLALYDGVASAGNRTADSLGRVQVVSDNMFNGATFQTVCKNFIQMNLCVNNVGEGIKKAGDEQEKLEKKSKKAKEALATLKKEAQGIYNAVGGVKSLQKALNLSDQVANTSFQLQRMTGSAEGAAAAQEQIYAAAQRSRAPYLSMADTVATLGTQTGDAFQSTEETVRFAELLNQQFALAGSSQQEMQSATAQITQALGKGQIGASAFTELNKAAPEVMQRVADYMGLPISGLDALAAKGQLSAGVLKDALFAAGGDINQQFKKLPLSFSQIWTGIQNEALHAFQPALQKLNELANSPALQTLLERGMTLVSGLGEAAAGLVDQLLAGTQFMADNWGFIEPILWGIIGVFAAWRIATIAQAVAQFFLNTAMWASPIPWIVLAVGLAITAFLLWINRLGGFRAFWLITMDVLLVAWDALCFWVMTGVYGMLNYIDTLKFGFQIALAMILNRVGDFKTLFLLLLQGIVNHGIDIWNQFLSLFGQELLPHITIGVDAMLENEAEKRSRMEELAAAGDELAQTVSGRGDALEQMRRDAAVNHQSRQMEIVQARSEANKKANSPVESLLTQSAGGSGGYPSVSESSAATAENTGKMADSLELSEEDLRYLRDIAERETVNRYTTAEIKVELGGVHQQIGSYVDADGLIDYMVSGVYDGMAMAAEGVHG